MADRFRLYTGIHHSVPSIHCHPHRKLLMSARRWSGLQHLRTGRVKREQKVKGKVRAQPAVVTDSAKLKL